MPADDKPAPTTPAGWSIFSIPRPIKRIFDAFPLHVYPPNARPAQRQRAPRRGAGHVLFLWTTPEDAEAGRASFNPGCLKWQAYFNARDVSFRTLASCNHASVSERLPFFVADPDVASPFSGSTASTSDFGIWAAEQKDSWPRELEMQYDAYMSLLDNEIQRIWQYHMYLTPNFEALTVPSYIGSQSSSAVVNILSAWELRQAARHELEKHSPKIDPESLYEDADRAFCALDNLMSRKRQQNTPGRPSLLEASLFSYLFLLLELPQDKWADGRLVELLRKYPGLVALGRTMKKDFMILEPPAIYGR